MMIFRVAGVALLLLAAGRADGGPEKSADVVEVKLERFTIADGLESFFVSLKVAEGWHVYANPAGAKALADSATTVEFLIDGKRAATNDIYYPEGVVRKGAAGDEYRAYEGSVSFTGWLVWDDTKGAKAISVRARVVAADGKTRLKGSVIAAEVR
jgi:hypothetical protein